MGRLNKQTLQTFRQTDNFIFQIKFKTTIIAEPAHEGDETRPSKPVNDGRM